MELMNGPQFAKKYVNDYLQSDIPIRLVDYRNGWSIDDETLPTPEKYLTYEPIALDTWPTLITIVLSTNSFTRIAYDVNDPLYRVEYSMRTYIWARTQYSEQTTLMRDRLTTVVRSALMDYPCLKAVDERDSFLARIDEGSIQEQFSDLTLLKGDRVLGGAFISYNLSIDEVIARRDIGTAQNINVEFSNLDKQ